MAGAARDTSVQLCGPLSIVLEGERRDDALRGRQSRLLLAYLVLNRGRMVARDELIEVLWQEGLPAAPSAGLSTLISRLRRALGPQRVEGRSDVRLVLPADTYVDVETARTLLACAQAAIFGERWVEARDDAAVALATIEKGLLPGHDAPWLQAARRELEEDRLEALDCIAKSCGALGGSDLAAGERAARELVERAPYRESGYLSLMRTRLARGDIAEALRVYDVLRVRLREELGTAPTGPIRDLHRLLLEDNWEAAAERTGRARDGVPFAVGNEPSTERPPTSRPPLPPILLKREQESFIGRERDLVQLRQALERTREEGLQLLLMAGEPGVGKTRLAARFGTSAHAHGATVLFGRSDEEALIAYQPLVESLRHYVLTADDQELEARVRDGGAILGRLLPELHRRVPRLADPPGSEPDALRYHLFEAVGSLLESLAHTEPVVLILDDLHWADRPTLSMLRHLVRFSTRAHLLVLAAYRESELRADSPAGSFLAAAHREGVSDGIRLEGLTQPDVTALVRESVGGKVSASFARQLHRQTDGNPFFLGELLRHLSESGRLEAGSADGKGVRFPLKDVGVPEGVRHVVSRRLARLDPQAHDVLRSAAVVGTDFDLSLLARVSEVPIDRLVVALQDAVDKGALIEATDAPDRYSFGHELLRAALYDEMTAARRIRLHRRIGEVLETIERMGAPVRMSELAHHFFESRSLGHPEKAIEYAIRAGDAAMGMLAYEDASEFYERALAPSDGPATDERRCRLLLKLGRAQWRAGETVDSRVTFRQAGELAEELGAPDLLAEAALGFGGGPFIETGIVDTPLIELLERALTALGSRDAPLRASALGQLAEALYFSGAGEPGLRLSAEALNVARRLGDSAALGRALNARRLALWGPDHLNDRLAASEELVSLAKRLGDRELLVQGRHWCIMDLLESGEADRAREQMVKQRRLAEELRQPFYLHYAQTWEVVQAQLAGDLDEVENLAEKARATGEGAQSQNAESIYVGQLFWLRREQDRIGELEAVCHDLVERLPRMPLWRAAFALMQAALERPDEARAAWEPLTADRFERIPRDFTWLTTMIGSAEVCAFLGDVERAEVLYELLLPYASRHVLISSAGCHGSVSRFLGILAAVQSDLDGAERHLEKAIAMNDELGSRPLAAHSRNTLARVLAARGRGHDRERANALALHALKTAEAVELPRLMTSVRKTLTYASMSPCQADALAHSTSGSPPAVGVDSSR